MGQTLSHGVYLPNEGERNCYAGLASNWQILNTAVGAIAEKAPLVHTHTVSQITDFPAYGTTAGTICEGNDSRLSDARTPVAHMHTKSDVTDLFNSANTWTGTNSFSIGNLEVQTEYTLGTLPQAESAAALFTGRTTDNNFVTNINFYQSPTRGTGLRFTIRNKWDNNGYSTTGTTRNAHFEFLQNIDKKAYLQWEGYVNNSLYPLANNSYDLGSSSYKWKTLNGINPGALSLPDYNNYLDVTSNIPVASLDGTQIDLNTYLADKTGWLSIVIADTAGNYITVTQGRSGGSTVFNNSRTFHTGAQSNGYISVFFPIIASMSKFAFIKASSLIQMRFYYCLGNG